MPDKTKDIQEAIRLVIKPGEQVTLAELDTRLYASFPALEGEDRRWVGVAVSTMIRNGDLLTENLVSTAYSDSYLVRRPADA
jgi:hypothetical protein